MSPEEPDPSGSFIIDVQYLDRGESSQTPDASRLLTATPFIAHFTGNTRETLRVVLLSALQHRTGFDALNITQEEFAAAGRRFPNNEGTKIGSAEAVQRFGTDNLLSDAEFRKVAEAIESVCERAFGV